MKPVEEKYDVGVIIARFQVPDLHEVHIDLIKSVAEKHQKVIVILGLSPVFDTDNPLDFEARKQMVMASFPNVIVAYIKDMPDDRLWSQKLDQVVADLINPNQTVVLYGGRDSFLDRYSGRLPVRKFQQERWISGSEIRNAIKHTVKSSRDFRHGVIWAANQRFPTVFSTTDVAILRKRDAGYEILLGQKETDGEKWRLIGGFVDPRDKSIEDAAVREVHEELGVNFEISRPEYVCSCKVDDWRYRNKSDSIMTHLFIAYHAWGEPKPSDDICAATWTPLTKELMEESLADKVIVRGHIPLIRAVCKFMKLEI